MAKKGTGSEPSPLGATNKGLPAGACPLLPRAVGTYRRRQRSLWGKTGSKRLADRNVRSSQQWPDACIFDD
jgi:hypothetical protein